MTDPEIFKLRPEAQATTWDELMPPVKKAIHDLLVRIYGAHHSVREKNTGKSADSSVQQTGNCFLVYGSRGTGKTTVLLNAQRAVCRKYGEGFFAETVEPPKTETDDEKREREAAKKVKDDANANAKKLQDKDGIIWLDILNLEPLPSEANLLTVLLTQVRKALHTYSDKRQRDQRSIFEEEADSAQQLLNRLIGETTLMWQNINEPNTRETASRQVKAADIYANFPEKFKKAMDKLIKELSETRGTDSKVSIVLPIDNIDRSTEHLQSIVKLAQLVSHPNLWLVMAGDRVEVETFLERAYWKELIRSSDGAGARGKMDSDGEDEALVMARRQANATQQKLWPTNHRVEINFLEPKETLKFDHSFTDKTTIKDLLKKIPIPTTEGQRTTTKEQRTTTEEQRKGKGDGKLSLLDLFDVEERVKEEHIETKEASKMTRASHHGLLLPARDVIELWQLLDWLTPSTTSIDESNPDFRAEKDESNPDFRAEKVVRTMLRNAISSSAMPNAVAQKLQNDILRRGETGGTVLFFGDTALEARPMRTSNHDFESALKPVLSGTRKHKLRSQLAIDNIEDIVLSLQHNYSPIKRFDSLNEVVKNRHPQHFLIENVNEKQGKVELPPLVAAWLMALYDILMFAEDIANSWVAVENLDIKWLNVPVTHSIVCNHAQNGSAQIGKLEKMNFDLNWNAPCGRFFLERNIFRLRWYNLRKAIVNYSPKRDQQYFVPRLLAAGWIFCALKTFYQLIKLVSQRKDKYDFINKIKFPLLPLSALETSAISETAKLEEGIIIEAANLYGKIKEEQLNSEERGNAAYAEIITAMAQWLEEELIYFLSYVYVPVSVPVSASASKQDTRLVSLWKILDNNSPLKQHWIDNKWFILAALDQKLADAKQSEEKHTATPSHQYTASLGKLAELHNFHW